jgi:hypothetical protein
MEDLSLDEYEKSLGPAFSILSKISELVRDFQNKNQRDV